MVFLILLLFACLGRGVMLMRSLFWVGVLCWAGYVAGKWVFAVSAPGLVHVLADLLIVVFSVLGIPLGASLMISALVLAKSRSVKAAFWLRDWRLVLGLIVAGLATQVLTYSLSPYWGPGSFPTQTVSDMGRILTASGLVLFGSQLLYFAVTQERISERFKTGSSWLGNVWLTFGLISLVSACVFAVVPHWNPSLGSFPWLVWVGAALQTFLGWIGAVLVCLAAIDRGSRNQSSDWDSLDGRFQVLICQFVARRLSFGDGLVLIAMGTVLVYLGAWSLNLNTSFLGFQDLNASFPVGETMVAIGGLVAAAGLFLDHDLPS